MKSHYRKKKYDLLRAQALKEIAEVMTDSRRPSDSPLMIQGSPGVAEVDLASLIAELRKFPEIAADDMVCLLSAARIKTELTLLDPAESDAVEEAARIWIPDVMADLLVEFRLHPERMYSMPPRGFEELVAEIFRRKGFQVQLTPPARDGGYDLIAIKKDDLTGDSVHLVECKRYRPDNPVRVGAVRGLFGVVDSVRATKGIIVTTSYFTPEAQAFAGMVAFVGTVLARLSLRDYDCLVEWLQSLPLAGR